MSPWFASGGRLGYSDSMQMHGDNLFAGDATISRLALAGALALGLLLRLAR